MKQLAKIIPTKLELTLLRCNHCNDLNIKLIKENTSGELWLKCINCEKTSIFNLEKIFVLSEHNNTGDKFLIEHNSYLYGQIKNKK